MHRSSLTLGNVDVTPVVRTNRTLTGSGEVLLSGCVDITDGFVVQSRSFEALLDISTAFADAALALQRLQDQVAAEQTPATAFTCNGFAIAGTVGGDDLEHVCSCGAHFSAPTAELLREAVDAHYGQGQVTA